MARLFGRGKRDARDDSGETEGIERHDLGRYASYVPASVRVPEMQRFAPLETADGPDEDLDFLSALAGEVDRARPSKPAARGDMSENQKMIDRKPDRLEIFREFAPDLDEKTSITNLIAIPDVDIGDVLEDLSTTAAALRLRKAA
jgi:hypothetical protein